MKNIRALFIFVLLTFNVFSQSNPTDYYIFGNELYNSGEYKKAVMEYTKLINATREPLVMKTGFVNRGLSYHKLKMYKKAINDFGKAIRLDSTDMASYIDRGLSHMAANELIEAKKDFSHVIRMNTDNKMRQNALYWQSNISYSIGEYDNVINYTTTYLISSPNDPEVLFYKASAYGMKFEFEKAIKVYDKIIEISPSTYQAFANRGVMKINILTTNGNIFPNKKETRSACKDLKKAEEMGDLTVEDMIFVHCTKRKSKNKN
jgi:tetratricopeptide (TPR) repeat protein